VRGLKAPPRKKRAPLRRTASAIAKAWARLSIAHGPAIIASSSPPIVASPMRTIVFSGRKSSVISLYGLLTRIASATPPRFSKCDGSMAPGLPVMPIAVRVVPGMGWALNPSSSITRRTASTWLSVASAFITINMTVLFQR
jgi:hypothetical protein